MAIIKTFNGVTILKPGAYSRIIVQNLSGFPLQPTGTVGIIGESLGGAPRVLDILEKAAIQDAKERYKEGPIADALDLLTNPSRDARIVNGASKVVVYKVNNSTQSSLALDNAVPAGVVTLQSKNYGDDENQISALLSGGAIADADAKILGTIAEPFNLSGGGDTLILDINGVTYTHTSTLSGAAETAAAVIADLNTGGTWAPSKPIIAAPNADNALIIDIALDPSVVIGGELDYGYISVDATSTLDTIIGIAGSDRGQKGSRILTITKGVITETSLEIGGVGQLSILYTGAGTLSKLSIQDVSGERKLTVVNTGAPGDDLDIVLEDADGKNKFTLKSLADLINANAAYTCSVVGPNDQLNANALDYYLDVVIQDVAMVLNKDIKDFTTTISLTSKFVDAIAISNAVRAMAPLINPVLLAGAGNGTALNSDWADGFNAFKEIRINTMVPLLSRDKGAVSIDSVNTLTDNHVRSMWATDGRSERNAYVSKSGTKDALKAAAQVLQSQYTSMCGQQVRVLDKFSELQWQDPWAFACVAAGLQAGSPVGEPITFKIMNVNDVRVEDGSWSPRTNLSEMIEAGVLFSEPLDTGGHRIVVGNTTYGVDGNFVYNRISVVEASGYIAFDLRFNLEITFTGTKARTGSAEAIANFIKNRMALYLREDITVGDDDNDGLGFKGLSIDLQGNTGFINISVTPVQGIDFLLPTIYLADIRQSA